MKVEQIQTIVNELSIEILGEGAIQAAEASKIVDVGREALGATDIENYTRKLIDHIGRVVFVNRPYSGKAPSVLMSGWEFGSILEKIDAGIPEAEANPTWNLQDGETYNQDKFVAPKDVVAKFFNDRVTFQVPFSFADEQVKSAFSNLTQLNAFFSMIYTKIETSFTIKLDSLIMSTIGNFMAGTVYNEFSAGVYNASSGIRAINLLYTYKQLYPDDDVVQALTPETAIRDLGFIKHAAYVIRLTSDHMTNVSTLFNVGGRVRHTAKDLQHIILLDAFASAADIYLQSDTFHNELTKLPKAETVSFWQGTGTGWKFEDTSKIMLTVKNPTNTSQTVNVTISGILGCIFDRDALGVNNFNRRVTKHYNAVGEFINSWYKMDAQYFNDFNENGVVFFVA